MRHLIELLRPARAASKARTGGAPTPRRGYALCGSPRSGSNYLCEVLSSTGVLGRPREYFNGAARRVHDDPDYPDDPRAQIDRVLTMGATPNGIYGLKLFPGLFDTVAPHVRLAEALPDLRYVRLRRLDVLGQAISWVRSIQTGQFRSTETPVHEPGYDGEAISRYIGQVCQRNARWDMFFARTGITPVELTYEEVSRDPQAAVDAVSRALDLGTRPRIDRSALRLTIQRDERSADWRARFLAEFGDRNRLDAVALLAE